jgi:murein DD-endopeptidase MepM/ murein hydrolase activator NlpD
VRRVWYCARVRCGVASAPLKNGVVPQEGDYVERGDVIIVVGNTGNSTGAHLHYHVTSRRYGG